MDERRWLLPPHSKSAARRFDRGLAHARGIHAVSEARTYVQLRMHWQNIRLQEAQGPPVDMNQTLKRAEKGEAGKIVYVPLEGKTPVPARFLIRPLPAEAARRNRERLRRNAAKKAAPLRPRRCAWRATSVP